MAEKVRRTKTKYKNIYYNESTKRYDVKYNFKEYDPITQKNRYKAKWKYNLRTISEAKEELAKLQTGKIIPEDKDITLETHIKMNILEVHAFSLKRTAMPSLLRKVI